MIYMLIALVVLLYVEAGRRTYQVIILSEPADSLEPLYLAATNGSVPWWFKWGYVALWAPLQVVAAICSARQRAR